MEDKVRLEDKQGNDIFLLRKQQKIELLKEELSEEIEKVEKYIKLAHSNYTTQWEVYVFLSEYSNSGRLLEALARAILKQERCNIVFPIGKYKGLSVEYAIVNDEKYCRWFLYNVKSEELKTLKIIDYLAKRLNGYDYWLSDPCKVIDDMLEDILPKHWIRYLEQNSLNELKNKFLIHKISIDTNSGCIYLDSSLNSKYTGSTDARW